MEGGTHLQSHARYENIFSATLVFAGFLIVMGFVMDRPVDILEGIYRIVSMQDLLITD